jgi:hypothetical protein
VNVSYTASFPLQFIGNLKKLVHLDASTNNINWIAPEIGSCCCLTDLTLSCNEIQVSVPKYFLFLGVPVFWGVTLCHWANLLDFFDCVILENEGTVTLRNVSDTSSHSRRPDSSAALQEPQICSFIRVSSCYITTELFNPFLSSKYSVFSYQATSWF